MSTPAATREPAPRSLAGAALGTGDEAIALLGAGEGVRLTRAQAAERVAGLAAALAAEGVGAGQRVALLAPGGLATALALLAVAQLDAAVAPLNPALSPHQLRAAIDDLGAAAVLAAPGADLDALDPRPGPALVSLHDEPGGAVGVRCLRPARATPERGEPGAGVALVLRTSGTTGQAKTVELTAGQLAASARAVVEDCELGAGDVGLCVMPLFHVHGIAAGLLAPLIAGGAVSVAPRFSASRFWEWARQAGATWYTAVPTIHETLVQRADRDGAPAAGRTGLRLARSASAAYPPARMARFEQRFGVPLLVAYGMTEAAHQVCANTLDPAGRRPGSVGRPRIVEAAVLDESGARHARGEGEVVLRGPSVIRAYAAPPEANRSGFAGGWFRTGDRGRIDDDGFLTLVGRQKEMINRGGEKIAPDEVDAALLDHPAVAEAATFAVPDDRYGEAVEAAVVLAAAVAEEALRDHCRRLLAAHEVPRRIHVLESLPRGPTGKVRRAAVVAAVAS